MNLKQQLEIQALLDGELAGEDAARVRALIKRILVAKRHGTLQFRIVHTTAIVKNGNTTIGICPNEFDADFGSASGNTVVNNVGQRRCRRIPKPT